jgi:hypothetical protein
MLVIDLLDIIGQLALQKAGGIDSTGADNAEVGQIGNDRAADAGLLFALWIAKVQDNAIIDTGAGIFEICFPFVIHSHDNPVVGFQVYWIVSLYGAC